MSKLPLRIFLILMAMAVFPADAESDNIDWRETNDYNAFLADSKRSMTIDRLATFLKTEAATRPPVKSGE